MEQCFSLQESTEIEISFNNTSPQFSDLSGLWASTSSPNFIYTSPEWQLFSLENGEEPLYSDFQQKDVGASLLVEKKGELCDSLLQLEQTSSMITDAKSGDEEELRSVVYGKRNSTFVKWKDSPRLPCLQPQKSQSLHKRCIRFLKCINDHRISPLHDIHGGRRVNHDHDKLAIHHVVAERKRREQMKQIFSALRAFLPINLKKGRATVLLETIDYVAHLKKRVEQLERRNEELEALLHEKTHHDKDNLSHSEGYHV